MNHAYESKSMRLQRVIKVLKGKGAYSTLHIATKARVCAVNSIISELRANDYRIGCFSKAVRGQRVWYYMLEGKK